MEPMRIDADAPRHPGAEPQMFDEWQAWHRVVDSLTRCSASIDINEEPLLTAAIEMWGEMLVALRMIQGKDVHLEVLDDRVRKFNRVLAR